MGAMLVFFAVFSARCLASAQARAKKLCSATLSNLAMLSFVYLNYQVDIVSKGIP